MLDIDENNLKHGLLGLIVALVEIIVEVLQDEAFRRMESGRLAEDEINRLGEALVDLNAALDQIKRENGITESVQSVRDGLDELVDDVLDRMLNPERWAEEVKEG